MQWQRSAALEEWKLPASSGGAHVPYTEDWPEVFTRLKAFVAERLAESDAATAVQGPPPPTPPPPPLASAEGEEAIDGATSAAEAATSAVAAAAAEAKASKRTKRLRTQAERDVWRHFEHRAAVAMPSLHLLRRGQMGRIGIHHLRRLRVRRVVLPCGAHSRPSPPLKSPRVGLVVPGYLY